MPATNNYSQSNPATQAPANSAFAITAHDTEELSFVTRAVYVGVSGDVVAKLDGDSAAVTFKNNLASCAGLVATPTLKLGTRA
jgi:hypothetical protein